MNILTVIFDMDGVLVDSEHVITKACLLALKEWNIKAKESDFKPFTGMGENKFIGGVANKYHVPFDLAMKKRAYEIYVEIVHDEIILYDGIYQLLLTLKKKGYHIALASSADLIKVEANLLAASIPTSIFEALVCGDMVENKKPAPDIFLKAADMVNTPYENCLVLEDALSGIEAAKRAHMKCAAVMSSFNKESFLPLHPDYIIKDTVDIIDYL